MRTTHVATERGCSVCQQRIDVVRGVFVRHMLHPDSHTECWDSAKHPLPESELVPANEPPKGER